MELPQNIINISIFGSIARSDDDERSDADILVVVKDRSGKVPEFLVQEFTLPLVGRKPTISWYGQERLRTMFADGHLFAWHLFRESRPIWGRDSIQDLFGRPSLYRDGLIDISSFQAVVEGIPSALRQYPRNTIYEFGLLYVCVRNIAMSASWHLCDAPDFTRYSPFNLNSRRLCIARSDYDLAMSCRMASQRGIEPIEKVALKHVLIMQSSMLEWAQSTKEDVEANVREEG